MTTVQVVFQHCKVTDAGCWEWQRGLNFGGYGSMRIEGKRWMAHRAAYELAIGPIPAGLDLDHLCRNRKCCNPEHLEPVTRSENLRRGEVGRWNLATTHCPQGHPYDDENTYQDKRGWRGCRTCRAEATKRYNDKKRAAA